MREVNDSDSNHLLLKINVRISAAMAGLSDKDLAVDRECGRSIVSDFVLPAGARDPVCEG